MSRRLAGVSRCVLDLAPRVGLYLSSKTPMQESERRFGLIGKGYYNICYYLGMTKVVSGRMRRLKKANSLSFEMWEGLTLFHVILVD